MSATVEPPFQDAPAGWEAAAKVVGTPETMRPHPDSDWVIAMIKSVRSEAHIFADYLIEQARHRLDNSEPAPDVPAAALRLVMRAPQVDFAATEVAVERFVRQDRLLAEADAGVPVIMSRYTGVEVGRRDEPEPIPIDIGLPPFDLTRATSWAESRRLYEGFFDSLPEVAVYVSPEQARGFFRSRLVTLLSEAVLLPARTQPSTPPAPPGYLFKVFTKTAGLRVHYSNTLFLVRNQAFGAPTTPVSRYLQPGRYTFGAFGPGIPVSGFWDLAEYRVPSPPDNAAYLDI
jgi:hypothetical protein